MDYFYERKLPAPEVGPPVQGHTSKPKPTAVKRQILFERHVKAVALSTLALDGATARLASELALEQVVQCDLLGTTERVAALLNTEPDEAQPTIDPYVEATCELQLLTCVLVLLNERVATSHAVLIDSQVAHLQLLNGDAVSGTQESSSAGHSALHTRVTSFEHAQQHPEATVGGVLPRPPSEPATTPPQMRPPPHATAAEPVDPWVVNDRLLQMLELGFDGNDASQAAAKHGSPLQPPTAQQPSEATAPAHMVAPPAHFQIGAGSSGARMNAWLDEDDSDDDDDDDQVGVNMLDAWSARTAAWAAVGQPLAVAEPALWDEGLRSAQPSSEQPSGDKASLGEASLAHAAPKGLQPGGAKVETLNNVEASPSHSYLDTAAALGPPQSALYATTRSLPVAGLRPLSSSPAALPALLRSRGAAEASRSFPMRLRPQAFGDVQLEPRHSLSHLTSVREDRGVSQEQWEFRTDGGHAALAPPLPSSDLLPRKPVPLTEASNQVRHLSVESAPYSGSSAVNNRAADAQPSRSGRDGDPPSVRSLLEPWHQDAAAADPGASLSAAFDASRGACPRPFVARVQEVMRADPNMQLSALQLASFPGCSGAAGDAVADIGGQSAKTAMLVQLVDWLQDLLRQRLVTVDRLIVALKAPASQWDQMSECSDVHSAGILGFEGSVSSFGSMRPLRRDAPGPDELDYSTGHVGWSPGNLRVPPRPPRPQPSAYGLPPGGPYRPSPSYDSPSHHPLAYEGAMSLSYEHNMRPMWPEAPLPPPQPRGARRGLSAAAFTHALAVHHLSYELGRPPLDARSLHAAAPYEHASYDHLLPVHHMAGEPRGGGQVPYMGGPDSNAPRFQTPPPMASGPRARMRPPRSLSYSSDPRMLHALQQQPRMLEPYGGQQSFPLDMQPLRLPAPPGLSHGALHAGALTVPEIPWGAHVPQSPLRPAAPRTMYDCKLCRVASNTMKDLLAHLASKGHQKRIGISARAVVDKCLGMLLEKAPQPPEDLAGDSITLLDRASELPYALVGNDDIAEVTQQLISKLCGFQSRAALANPAKGRSRAKKRCLAGIRENMWALKKGSRTRLVVLATNVQVASGNGVLMQQIRQLVEKCQEQSVPAIITLTRKQLGTCFVTGTQGDVRHKAMSAIAVLDISGAEKEWMQLQRLMAIARPHEAAPPLPTPADDPKASADAAQEAQMLVERANDVSRLLHVPESVAAEEAWQSVRPALLAAMRA